MRLMFIRLTPEFITKTFGRANKTTINMMNGLPPDSELIRIEFEKTQEYTSNSIKAIIRSEEFENVPEGGSIKEFELLMEHVIEE